ncbi:MAG: SMR family transporter [Gaiellaceae bacterium]
MFLVVLCVVYAVLNASGLLLLRVSLQHAHGSVGIRNVIVDPRFVGGIVCYGFAFLTWLVTLSMHPVSTVYPVFTGVAYSSVILASFVLLNEHSSTPKLVGISLVGIGILFVVR